MGSSPGSILLFDAASSANRFIDDFIWVYILLIFIYVLSSWVRLPYSPWLRRIQDFLRDVCEPYLALFRRILPSFGPLDLSPVVAVIVLIILKTAVDGRACRARTQGSRPPRSGARARGGARGSAKDHSGRARGAGTAGGRDAPDQGPSGGRPGRGRRRRPGR